jgi:Domain of unknown function (DUF4124)
MKTGWYVALALLNGWTAHVSAEQVYKCRGSDGHLSYQARPCAQGQSESTVTIHKAPPPRPLPATKPTRSAPPNASTNKATRVTAPPRPPLPQQVMSYKCTAQDGRVFYRHHACPPEIDIGKTTTVHPIRGVETWYHTTPVASQAVPRAEACAAINKLTVSSRKGYELDDRVSSYDKNLGRGPCKEY